MVQKCEYCKIKKINILLAYSCKCGVINLCTICRDPNKHNCIFDYKKDSQEKLKKTNMQIIADKVNKI